MTQTGRKLKIGQEIHVGNRWIRLERMGVEDGQRWVSGTITKVDYKRFANDEVGESVWAYADEITR